jgi:hypothetical protein
MRRASRLALEGSGRGNRRKEREGTENRRRNKGCKGDLTRSGTNLCTKVLVLGPPRLKECRTVQGIPYSRMPALSEGPHSKNRTRPGRRITVLCLLLYSRASREPAAGFGRYSLYFSSGGGSSIQAFHLGGVNEPPLAQALRGEFTSSSSPKVRLHPPR